MAPPLTFSPSLLLQVRLRGGVQWRRRARAHAGEVLREDRAVSHHLHRRTAAHQVRVRLRDARRRLLRPLRGLQDRWVLVTGVTSGAGGAPFWRFKDSSEVFQGIQGQTAPAGLRCYPEASLAGGDAAPLHRRDAKSQSWDLAHVCATDSEEFKCSHFLFFAWKKY